MDRYTYFELILAAEKLCKHLDVLTLTGSELEQLLAAQRELELLSRKKRPSHLDVSKVNVIIANMTVLTNKLEDRFRVDRRPTYKQVLDKMFSVANSVDVSMLSRSEFTQFAANTARMNELAKMTNPTPNNFCEAECVTDEMSRLVGVSHRRETLARANARMRREYSAK